MSSKRKESIENDKKKVWRKILYERQDFPDNYSPEPQFLIDLRKNVTAETYTFWESVIGSCVLTQALGIIVAYAVIFALVMAEVIPSVVLAAAVTLAGFLGFLSIFIVDRLSDCSITTADIRREIKTLAVFLGFGYGMSPVFKSLTETISTDTIYATATFMFLLSAIFHDYGVDVFIVSASQSLNAAIFGAVCLISRLPTSNDAFTLLALAVELFGFFPILRTRLCQLSPRFADVWTSSVFAAGNVLGLAYLQPICAVIYIALHLFICFICPLWLINLQPLKSTIHGPWDEAVIQENS